MNEALRRALIEARLRDVDVAACLGVDPKTVRRWLTGRTPYPRHRAAIAELVARDELEIWPEVLSNALQRRQTEEIIAVYPHRWAVPREVWRRLFASAEREIGILVYSGLFLAEDVGVLQILADKARSGVTVRLLLGDPDSPCVIERGHEEGIGDSMAARIRNALALYRSVQKDAHGIEIRLHRSVLYNSIYLADDELLANPHIYGAAAFNAPVLHLRRAADDGIADVYLRSFERVWTASERLCTAPDRNHSSDLD